MSLRNLFATALLVIVLSSMLQGCAGQPDNAVQNRTSTFASASGGVIWLATQRHGLSVVGKDYLFAGPMAVNRGGTSQRVLWLGTGTTIDRHITGAAKPELASIVFDIDGTPMSLDLQPWDVDAADTPFSPDIVSRRSYVARITASQLRTLGEADVLRAWVTDQNGRSPAYEIVKGAPENLLASR